ncbi:WGR domain-containing protein [Aphelenchoides avenae]|nr:WGR domain-containing protein [Aphelenchus avenae]
MESPVKKLVKAEYAASGASKCISCAEFLRKGELRMRVKNGGFYHPECYRESEGFDGAPESIDGINKISEQDKNMLASEDQSEAEAAEFKIDTDAQEQAVMPPPATKEVKLDGVDDVQKQKKVLHEVRRLFLANMLESQMVILLKANNCYDENVTIKTAIEMLVDGAVFGVPSPCPDCNGVVAFDDSMAVYSCLGCNSYQVKVPKRTDMVIPSGMRDNDFLASYEIPKLPERIIDE